MAWYAKLGARDRAFADRALDRLAASGPDLRMPHSRDLGGGLHELRFSCEGVQRRITYALGDGREVAAFTTFRKQREREPREVERAHAAKARNRSRADTRTTGARTTELGR